MDVLAEYQEQREQSSNQREWAALVALIGLALLLALAYWWASRQTEPVAIQPAPATTTTSTTAPPPPEPVASSVNIERSGNAVTLSGMVQTESERDALTAAVANAGLDVDDQITVSEEVADSDPRVIAALLANLLDGTDDGQLTLSDGRVTITGEALDPVEAEEIQAAIDTATAAGLEVNNQTTVRVLPAAVQVEKLQEEINQIFELAREIEGQYPNFDISVDGLSDGATATLDRVAVAMRRYPLPAADVIGHTDSTGPAATNQTLSEERAQAVADYLVDVGVEAERLQVIGRGEDQPIADNNSEEGRAQNRRVDFLVKLREG